MHPPQTTAAKCVLWHHAKDWRWCRVATQVSVKHRVADLAAECPVCRADITIMRIFRERVVTVTLLTSTRPSTARSELPLEQNNDYYYQLTFAYRTVKLTFHTSFFAELC